VVVSDIDEKRGRETVRMIQNAQGEAAFVRTDVSKPGDCQALVDAALEKYGRLDIAFNNAGIGGEANPIAEYSLEGWQKVIDVNLSSVFYCMKYEVPAMLQAGGGAIVNITSVNGIAAAPNAGAYTSTKAAIIMLTEHMALEWAPSGIRVNAVAPGLILAGMSDPIYADPEIRELRQSKVPLGTLGTADDVAAAVLFLASEKAGYVTGQTITVDGGLTKAAMMNLSRPKAVDSVGQQ
jgi:NAD(P)-dependent dehydrogenase (short-subunit alcohol dehydrogenase family)